MSKLTAWKLDYRGKDNKIELNYWKHNNVEFSKFGRRK